ncbi:MAG TPA: alpha/beta hydrolase [Solirubrobacteraceae bacterium]|jgi:pimeloyl-ACP methyl ester carboxylesterase|nr:alpha/beta hydrolase [Solirubrobacteraceae bacterium]
MTNPAVSEHTALLGELPIFWRSAPTPAPGGGQLQSVAAPAPSEAAPALYVHGVPTSSDDWMEFLRRGGGLAPDLPGFGRSGKPGHFDYSIGGYARFIEQYLDLLEVERVRLVVHDWGAVGLAFAQRHPERVERLVVMNAIPFLPGYRWHRTARIWRTPLLGELAMGTTTRRTLRLTTRESNVAPGPLPDAWIDAVLRHFDHGTQRAILRLYRSSPPDELARAGSELHRLRAPALVVWGMRDPYISGRFAADYARALPAAELLELPDAGHWWWLDRPDAIERVLDWLASEK